MLRRNPAHVIKLTPALGSPNPSNLFSAAEIRACRVYRRTVARSPGNPGRHGYGGDINDASDHTVASSAKTWHSDNNNSGEYQDTSPLPYDAENKSSAQSN